MKKFVMISIILLAGCSISFPVDARSVLNKTLFNLNFSFLRENDEPEEEFVKEFKVQSGKLLDIDLNTGGGVKITGWDKEEFYAKVRLEGRDWKEIKVNIEETQEGVKITSAYEKHKNKRSGGADLEIMVPRKFNLKIETMGGGITLSGLEGEFSGSTMGGGLALAKLKGRLNLKTMGGGISLTSSEVDGDVSTMGGSVVIRDVTGDIKGSSMGGTVKYENVTSRDGKSTGKEVRISSMGGAIDVDEAPGGAELSTMGGSIRVKTARDHVKAKTMGGDIEIKDMQGWLDATTMSGDVEVNITGSDPSGSKDIKITSMSGDVTLTVPSSFSMDVTVEVSHNENQKNNKINSDFGLKIEESEDDDNQSDTPQMVLSGRGTFNGGKNKVYIKTLNGTVNLKKS